ncbi:hypothetical protein V1512DRAFT_71878 [Lipomyces arxii]|uniref:uncharacterized protein n=1 Tax=Lipomyces arxii TaxID=56418 RepID=UPI0034CF4B69
MFSYSSEKFYYFFVIFVFFVLFAVLVFMEQLISSDGKCKVLYSGLFYYLYVVPSIVFRRHFFLFY